MAIGNFGRPVNSVLPDSSEGLVLESGKTYVFKDDKSKEEYLKAFSLNKGFYENYYLGGFTVESLDSLGNGCITKDVVISENELYLFKEKPSQTTTLWDGISDLEVDMVVGRNCSGRTHFKIKYVGVDYCILESVDDKVEHSVKIGNIMTLQPTHKEETFEKVLSAWNKSSLDNAYDGKNAIVGLEDFFDVMYDVMK